MEENIDFEKFNNKNTKRDKNLPNLEPWENIGLLVLDKLDTMDKKIEDITDLFRAFVKDTNDELKVFANDMTTVKTIIKGIVWTLALIIATAVGYVVFLAQQNYIENSDKVKKYEELIDKQKENKRKKELNEKLSAFIRIEDIIYYKDNKC